MKVKGIIAEDICNYRFPSMFISTATCDWKCCNEAGLDISVCQNSSLLPILAKEIDDKDIYWMYINNPITKAVVLGGLEPMLQFNEVVHLLNVFRDNGCSDEFVIYTGYYPQELGKKLDSFTGKNVIVKFGRYIPNSIPRYDDILGVTLASDNQFSLYFE